MNNQYPTEEQAIKNLQRYLRQLSHLNSAIPRPPVDGIYNDVTRSSLSAFQSQNGLPVTGVADERTWNLLYAQYLRSIEDNSPPHAIVLFPRHHDAYEVYAGEESFLVLAIQHMLHEIGVLYDDLGDFEMSGIYDEATAHAVGEFQVKNLLPRTERVDKKTHDKLVDSYNILSKDYRQ